MQKSRNIVNRPQRGPTMLAAGGANATPAASTVHSSQPRRG